MRAHSDIPQHSMGSVLSSGAGAQWERKAAPFCICWINLPVKGPLVCKAVVISCLCWICLQ